MRGLKDFKSLLTRTFDLCKKIKKGIVYSPDDLNEYIPNYQDISNLNFLFLVLTQINHVKYFHFIKRFIYLLFFFFM